MSTSISPAGSVVTTPAQSVYQKQFASLQQYDTQELLYASFLSPDDALANGNAVLSQAAKLLDSKSYEAQPPATTTDPTTTTGSTTTGTSTTGTPASATTVPARQSITDILKASDDAANAALKAYSNAPAGSSIIDFNA